MDSCKERAAEFLEKHGMLPTLTDPEAISDLIYEDMKAGLGDSPKDLPMIPTYLRLEGEIKEGDSAIVIDAGGTNLRTCLVSFDGSEFRFTDIVKSHMPGTEGRISFDDFIAILADRIEGLCAYTDLIGFCFSFPAAITPEKDGRVILFDKQVEIEGAGGKLLGESLNSALAKRGIGSKKIVVLNDTAATLLGGAATVDRNAYSGFIGHIAGTGVNTCCMIPMDRIPKLRSEEKYKILINNESGFFRNVPIGDFDKLMDSHSLDPGTSLFEKMISGAYLGTDAFLTLKGAAQEGYFGEKMCRYLASVERSDSAFPDNICRGIVPEGLENEKEDFEFAQHVCFALFERSARLMCASLLATVRLTGEGTDPSKPVLVLAEGSMAQKSLCYTDFLRRKLKEYSKGYSIEVKVVSDTNLIGSAAAVIFNS